MTKPETSKKAKRPDINPEALKGLDIFTTHEAAVYLRTSPSTLAHHRVSGGGPKFVRQSARKVLYRRTDCDAWLAERVRANTSEVA